MSEWQPVYGYEGRYEVSSDGQIRSVTGRAVGQWLNDQGYMMVRLSQPRRMIRVHRIVAEAFVPNPLNCPTVNHKNNRRSDNRSENLEWCSQAENLAHANRQGRMQHDYWLGKRGPNARLNDEKVAMIRAEYVAGGTSWERLGKKYGISKRAIGRLLTRETYV